jgi:pimeloyl-ACP methyl ester carboxylesterase
VSLLRKAIIVISGFGQSSKRINGCHVLVHKLRSMFEYDDSTMVFSAEWDSDFDELVARICNLCGEDRPEIVVAGYSWGAGNGVPKLAKALDDHDYDIDRLVLCDPVVCHSWLVMLFVGLFRSWFTFEIPDNVRSCWVLWQRRSRPMGYPVSRIDEKYTTINKSIELPYSHSEMDNCREFQDLCLEIA